MARVPTYDSPQVEQRALPGVRQSSVASPALFGAQAEQMQRMGQGLTNAGSQLNNVAMKMQERENADMIFRAESALKDDYLAFEQASYQRKGIQANGLTADAEKFFEEQGKKHSELLQNDQQRHLFSVSLTKLRQSSMGQFARYEAREGDAALDASTQATIGGTIRMAAADASNGMIVPSSENKGDAEITTDKDGNTVVKAPGITVGNNPIEGYKREIKNRVAVLANLRGMGKPEQAEVEAKYVSDMHVQVMQNMVDNDPSGARAYYKLHKDEVDGTQRDSVERVLKVGETRGRVQRSVDALMNAGAGADEAATLKQIREDFVDEPEMRDAVTQEFKARIGERRQLREAGQKDAADQAWKIYSSTGTLKAIPSSTIAAMDGRDVETLRAHAQNKAAGVSVKTDPGTYYDLRTLSAQDPAAFRKLDLRRFVNVLSPSDFQEFVKLQTDPAKQNDAATLTQQLSNTHDLMKWGSGDQAKKGTFDKAVTDAIQVEQTRLGKPLTYEQRQQVIDKMLIQGEVDGSGWLSDKKTYYEVQGTPDATKFEPKISDADKLEIINRFQKKNGRAPNKNEINSIYKVWKGL